VLTCATRYTNTAIGVKVFLATTTYRVYIASIMRTHKSLDNPTPAVVTNNGIDKSPRIVLAKPDASTLNQARRWILGAALLLDKAANGDPVIERLAREAMQLSVVAEIVLAEMP
jgi:hypothetical protein